MKKECKGFLRVIVLRRHKDNCLQNEKKNQLSNKKIMKWQVEIKYRKMLF